jgi:hypothetical protein
MLSYLSTSAKHRRPPTKHRKSRSRRLYFLCSNKLRDVGQSSSASTITTPTSFGTSEKAVQCEVKEFPLTSEYGHQYESRPTGTEPIRDNASRIPIDIQSQKSAISAIPHVREVQNESIPSTNHSLSAMNRKSPSLSALAIPTILHRYTKTTFFCK